MAPQGSPSARIECGPTGAAAPAAAEFTIRQLSGEFGVTLRALRFYEAREFLTPRREGPLRYYRQADRERLMQILKAKKLGFTLREIARMLADVSPGISRAQCVEQINLLERQKREIEAALTELRREYSGHYLRKVESGAFGEG